MIKKPAKSNNTFTAAQVGTLVEEFRSEFRIFGEELKAVKDKTNMTFEELGLQKESIWIIRVDIAVLKADVAVLKTDMKEIKDMLSIHDKRLVRLGEAGLK